ncbi:MAG: FAD-dependent oxidoreductase, partial [Pseudomonadota bacterium]
GMLRWGIPAYRLPRDILNSEIEGILGLGIELRNNTRVGRDITWDEVRSGFDAVYVAVGAQQTSKSGLTGDAVEGVLGAVEFLRALNLGEEPAVGGRVAVIGGGNSAIDASRSALRLGAQEVTVLYRRMREDMPAQEEEIKAAEEEGVKIATLVSPIRLEAENGRLKKIICQRMTPGDFDESGRRRPVPKMGDEFAFEADQIIQAVGQSLVDAFGFQKAGIKLTLGGLIDTVGPHTTCTEAPMVFAGGDAVSGPDTVVGAIAAGRRAAGEIDEAIRRKNAEPPYIPMEEDIEIPMIIEGDIKEIPRVCMLETDCSERTRDFREVELGFTRELALFEVGRCLRCDIQME